MPVTIETFVSEPFAENSFLLWQDGSTEAIVVDPGFEPEKILERLTELKLTLTAILNTHGHADHIAGNQAMKEAFPNAPLIIGAGDAAMLQDPVLNLSANFGVPLISPPQDRTVREGDTLTFAGITLEVLELPGHSPGHVVYLIRDAVPPRLLGGDVLFRGSIGRFDFPGGSFEQLLKGIQTKLGPLPDETIVYPGHDDLTTLGHEKRTNPYLRRSSSRSP